MHSHFIKTGLTISNCYQNKSGNNVRKYWQKQIDKFIGMSSLAVSQIQKHFITNEIYKRSKRYFDVIKLKSMEKIDSKCRRVPNVSLKQDLEKKMQDSFISSHDYFTTKRLQEIQKSKEKCFSFYMFDDPDQTETNYTVTTKKLPAKGKKTFDMSKGLSREFIENLQNQNYNSIDVAFDNHAPSDFEKGQKCNSIDFSKILGRKQTFSKQLLPKNLKCSFQDENPLKTKEQIAKKNQPATSNVAKIYEKFFFDQSKFKCLIDVEKERKAKNRRSLRTSLKDQGPKQISLQKIQRGRHFSQRNPGKSSVIFYHGNGKQQPSQMHLKVMKKNESYWVEQLKVMKRADFQTIRRRQEMVEKRLKEIKARKKVVDDRNQICDAKFFLRNKNL